MSATDHDHTQMPQEDDVVPGKLVLGFMMGALLIASALLLWSWLTLWVREGHLRPSRQFPEALLGAPYTIAGVRQHTFDSYNESAELTRRQRRQLNSFGWVDREHGLVHIPVERAIDLLVERKP